MFDWPTIPFGLGLDERVANHRFQHSTASLVLTIQVFHKLVEEGPLKLVILSMLIRCFHVVQNHL